MTLNLFFVLIAATMPQSQVAATKPAVGMPADDVVLKAMVDELDRAVAELQLDDLPKPYFVHMHAQERTLFNLAAAYGGLVRDQDQRNRYLGTRIRVGSPGLDNTNVPGSAGQIGILPLDNDYTALRHSMWLLLDQDYKQAVETLTRKEAYLRSKTAEDRAEDFSSATVTAEFEPIEQLQFDRKRFADLVTRLSAQFSNYPKIQNADVSLVGGAATHWIVNSEGTRLRTSDTGFMIQIRAETQATDGMPLSDSRTFIAKTEAELPTEQKITAELDEMAGNLTALAEAPVLEQYTGPVLFDAPAAGAVFEALLADGLCARPVPVGARWPDDSLEKKIGLRILPKSYSVYDDPAPEDYEGEPLAGAYRFDDEGVPAARVMLVEKGILQTLVAGRAPTKKIKGSTGHGRSGGFGDPRAQTGCLYIADENAISDEELKKELIQAAKDEGLPFGLRVAAMGADRDDSLPNPIYAYKVHVEDGREEMVRGMHFLPVQTRALKRLLASGKTRAVHNSLGQVGSSIIAPGILFEELELNKIEREFDKLPILPSPVNRVARNEETQKARNANN